MPKPKYEKFTNGYAVSNRALQVEWKEFGDAVKELIETLKTLSPAKRKGLEEKPFDFSKVVTPENRQSRRPQKG